MTHVEIDTLVSDAAAKAIIDAANDPAIAAMILLDAACMMMIVHMARGAALKLAPTYGQYIVDQVNAALGAGEVVQ